TNNDCWQCPWSICCRRPPHSSWGHTFSLPSRHNAVASLMSLARTTYALRTSIIESTPKVPSGSTPRSQSCSHRLETEVGVELAAAGHLFAIQVHGRRGEHYVHVVRAKADGATKLGILVSEPEVDSCQ